MINKVIVMGRLTRDPQLRHTQSNTPVTSFTLAIDRSRNGSNGERQTDFIDVVVWNRQAEFVKQWFAKGMMCIAIGRIQSRAWEDKNGNKRTTIEVVADEISFGESKKARGQSDDVATIQPHQAVQTYTPLRMDDDGFTELADDVDVPY